MSKGLTKFHKSWYNSYIVERIMIMSNIKVQITDGRRLNNHPDCIIILNSFSGYRFYVTAEIWNKYTNNTKLQTRQSLILTKELFVALNDVRIENPPKTNNTIPQDISSNICPRCGGSGIIETYRHINGGMCFECNGTGKHHD